MKVNKLICIIAVFGICVNFSMAQNRTFEDIALDYLKERLNKQSNGLKSDETKYYELPNGNMIVLMHVKWSDGYVEDVYDVPSGLAHGNYLTPQGWVHSDVVVKRTELKGDKGYAVFVSRTGNPLTHFVIPEKYDIVPVKQGYICFLFDKSFQNVGGRSTPFYNNVICRDYEGNRLWGFPDDLVAFNITNTENNVYIAGEIIKDDGAYSLVRAVDIKTGKTKDHVGKRGEIALSVMNTDEGIKITEYVENGSLRDFTLPYEDNDKNFQFKVIMNAYNQSKASDQVLIGERYLTGKGFSKDEKKAFEWFQKAANQNDSEGLFKLGYCYQNGYGATQNKEMAVEYYEKSAKQGNSNAISAIAKMYANGDGIPKNMSRAIYWQEVLAFKGDKEAQNIVLANQSVEHEKATISGSDARNMAIKSHKESNYKWARYCVERAIELGDDDAAFLYGSWLCMGDGIEQDYPKAISLLTPIAENGHLNAQKKLFYIYDGKYGNGFAPDKNKKIYWMSKVAENGDEEFQMVMANWYELGHEVKKDKKKAFEMYERATKKGNQKAKINMVYMLAAGNGTKKDIERAKLYFDSLPQEIEGEIADNIFWGVGTKKDKKLGLELYYKAAAKGNQKAGESYRLWKK